MALQKRTHLTVSQFAYVLEGLRWSTGYLRSNEVVRTDEQQLHYYKIICLQFGWNGIDLRTADDYNAWDVVRLTDGNRHLVLTVLYQSASNNVVHLCRKFLFLRTKMPQQFQAHFTYFDVTHFCVKYVPYHCKCKVWMVIWI